MSPVDWDGVLGAISDLFPAEALNEQGKAPAAGALQPGELAVNYAAGSPGLYIEDDAGTVVLLADAGASAGGKVDKITGTAPIVVENGDSDAPNIKFNDAPNDGKQYARKNLGWAEVDIPDVPPATSVGTTAPAIHRQANFGMPTPLRLKVVVDSLSIPAKSGSTPHCLRHLKPLSTKPAKLKF